MNTPLSRVCSITLSTLSALFAAGIFAVPAFAADSTACYRIERPDAPDNAVVFQSHSEIWCYQKLDYPQGATYIFNGDRDEARPELALMIEADGVMTHGSLLAGKMTVHKTQPKSFNPFTIPLQEPRALPVAFSQDVLSPKLRESAMKVLALLQSAPAQFSEQAVQEGEISARVADEVLPWRGYWWPYEGLPLSGPMAKYDRFVKARTGTSPRAQSWENSHHTYHGIWWEGHCNGWAASSILRKEPAFSKYDAASGTTFTVVDQKGILAETDYCATVAFYGKRYPSASNDIRDIYPAEFHQAITYYIGQLGKPVAMDYHRTSTVDNHVVSGYKMSITKTGDLTYNVTTILSMHKYDGSRQQKPGVAPEYTRTYRYRLTVDAAGTPVSGSWISTNPDFIWVPLAATDCNTNNPRIDHAMTAAILDLPAATPAMEAADLATTGPAADEDSEGRVSASSSISAE